ncbi:MAG: integrase catalytic domain-containing protein [Ignavibacteria bacterium]|nr:integrase catalytic domain-containing protein [Ignavibacteria bacterium]
MKTDEFAKNFNLYRTENWNDNSAGKYIRLFRRFLFWASDRNLLNTIEFPACLALPKDNEPTLFALTQIELSTIENLDLTDRPSLDRVRDLFLISTFTGLRYSDVSRIGKEHIGAKEILLSVKKTGESVRCPIHPRLRIVLDKYAPDYDFPKISGQKANMHLKTMATIAGITDRMEIVTWKNGKKSTEVKSKNEVISWHCARRTFITLSLILGANQAAVQAVSGHKKDSKSFNKYVLFASSQVDDAINSAWK